MDGKDKSGKNRSKGDFLALLRFGGEAQKYFFAPRSVETKEEDVTFIAIEDVFSKFDQDPKIKIALDLILGEVASLLSPGGLKSTTNS
jgi:hypothetical protein